ncbi:MAG: hypothetical protein ACYST0_12375, partial [Planctomycetota bacterium]
LYFARDYDTASSGKLELDIAGVNLAGVVFNVTGNEFSGSAGPGPMELSTADYLNEFRLRPDASNEMYFIGRPVRKVSGTTITYFDANIYKWGFDKGGQATRVTNYTGSATSLVKVVHIESLVVLSNGAVVYAASTGPAASAAGQEQRVTWHKGDGASAPITLGKFAKGAFVRAGTIQVQESIGGVYWVQSDTDTVAATNTGSATNTRAYFARIDNMMKGHPLNLTGVPKPATSGLKGVLSVGSTQN